MMHKVKECFDYCFHQSCVEEQEALTKMEEKFLKKNKPFWGALNQEGK